MRNICLALIFSVVCAGSSFCQKKQAITKQGKDTIAEKVRQLENEIYSTSLPLLEYQLKVALEMDSLQKRIHILNLLTPKGREEFDKVLQPAILKRLEILKKISGQSPAEQEFFQTCMDIKNAPEDQKKIMLKRLSKLQVAIIDSIKITTKELLPKK